MHNTPLSVYPEDELLPERIINGLNMHWEPRNLPPLKAWLYLAISRIVSGTAAQLVLRLQKKHL